MMYIKEVFNKKSSVSDLKSEIMPTQKLVEELHKPIIRKFEKRKVNSSFKEIIWGADLVDMELIGKFNKRFLFLLCVIDIYSQYTWVVLLKDKERYYN